MRRSPNPWIALPVLIALAPLCAAVDEVVKLPAVVVEEKAIHAELARWSYARAGQCEVLTDRGPALAEAIARDLCVVAEYLRFSHPEADIPKRTPLRLVLDSGSARKLLGAGCQPGHKVQRGTVGIFVAGEDEGERIVAAFRRELVMSGFADGQSKLPLWYRLALRNLVAEVWVTGTTVVAGQPVRHGRGPVRPNVMNLDELESAFRLRADSPEYRDEKRRAVLEQQATAFVRLCLYSNRGAQARNLVLFVLDPTASDDPPGAFARAFGFSLDAVDTLVWEGAKLGKYSPMTVRCPIDPTPTSRAAHPSDLDDFRYALGVGG